MIEQRTDEEQIETEVVEHISDQSQINGGAIENSNNTSVTANRRLTGKEKEYIRGIASGKTRRQAVRDSYDVKSGVSLKTLDNMASRIEKRPQVLAVLQQHETEAQQTVTDVMQYSRDIGRNGTKEGGQYARVALDGANSILDRLHGKAMQSVQVQSTSVNINIDLTMDE